MSIIGLEVYNMKYFIQKQEVNKDAVTNPLAYNIVQSDHIPFALSMYVPGGAPPELNRYIRFSMLL